ncbi:hypothetical protein R6Q57_010609 [Mikania cordata]
MSHSSGLHRRELSSHLSPSWHDVLQPLLWMALALIAVTCAPLYKQWPAELRSAPMFLAALVFMICALLYEMISVCSVTAVLGLTWRRFPSSYFRSEFDDEIVDQN